MPGDVSLDTALNKSLQLAFPPVLTQLLNALMDPDPSFDAISEYLGMDPMLSARVLQIANSPVYGFSQKVTDITRAAVVLGTSEIFRLVISLAVQKRLHPVIPRDKECLYADWRLTVWSAIAADALAENLCPKFRNQAFLAAMLKDLPLLLAFCQHASPPFINAYTVALMPSKEQFQAEKQWWGSTHNELAHDIALMWNLPAAVAEAIRTHHDMQSIQTLSSLAKCVTFATFWSELIHNPVQEASKISAFELALINHMGCTMESVENIRLTSAQRFNSLLAQLDIDHSSANVRVHERSLASLQSCHFLALENFTGQGAASLEGVVANLQRQMQTLWGFSDWDACFYLGVDEPGTLFRCRADHLETTVKVPARTVPHNMGWRYYPFGSLHIDEFFQGYLALPSGEEPKEEDKTFPLFVHMLGLHLKSFKPALSSTGILPLEDVSLPVARINSSGAVLDCSKTFLEFGNMPLAGSSRLSVSALLHGVFGLPLKTWDEYSLAPGYQAGRLFLSEAGPLKGEYMYVALSPPDQAGERYLFLGGVKPQDAPQQRGRKDELTGLPSLSRFHQILDREAALARKTGKTMGIAYCDLVNFHKMNETFGFSAGDALLIRVAGAFSSLAEDVGAYVCRYQGDDFILLVPDTSRDGLVSIADALRAKVREACRNSTDVHTGLALIPPSGAQALALRMAREACYSARTGQAATIWATDFT